MLSEKSQNANELLKLLRNAADEYCMKHRLPMLPVYYGEVKETSGLEFNIFHPSIIVSRHLPTRLGKHSPYNRVWYMLEAVGHELKHYDQYIRLKKRGIPLRKELFGEDEAYLAGYYHADNSVTKYTTEQINPLASVLATVGGAALAGVGLGIGFSAVNYAKGKLSKTENPTRRERLLDKYIWLERQLDTASDRRGRTIERELSRLEVVYGITPDEIRQRREELSKKSK